MGVARKACGSPVSVFTAMPAICPDSLIPNGSTMYSFESAGMSVLRSVYALFCQR
jgi:hypothetical protein